MLHITLSKKKPANPDDALGRDFVGFDPHMTEAELHEANRGCWVLGARADTERYALFSFEGIVVQAMQIDRIVPAGTRRALEGPVLQPGHPVYEQYVGRESPQRGMRNPVTYFDAPVARGACLCGCGGELVRGTFLPGHDQRAIHDRIAKLGGVREFIEWFDATYQPAA
jgi:hypothetical protein